MSGPRTPAGGAPPCPPVGSLAEHLRDVTRMFEEIFLRTRT